MPMNSVTPGTPNLTVVAKVSLHETCQFVVVLTFNLFQDGTGRLKIVVALYPFKAIEAGDLSLEKVIN